MSEGGVIPASLMQKWGAWISERIHRRTGMIHDPYHSNPLHFQYHYPAFLLGRACAPEDGFPDSLSLKVWEYFSSISWKEQKVTISFNSFLLSLLHYQLRRRKCPFAASIKEYLLKFPLPLPVDLANKNNNFTFMIRFVLYYILKHFSVSRDPAMAEYTESRMRTSCCEDGFIIDTLTSGNKGYASLVYHTKMAGILLCNWVLNDCEGDFHPGKKAIDSLLKLAEINYVLAYGRSQLSIFGYANLYLSLRILGYFYPNAEYTVCAKAVSKLLEKLQFPNGEAALNPAGNNKSRPGFDGYMHSIVYNCYAWAIVGFAEWLIESKSLAGKEVGKQGEESSFMKVQPIDILTSGGDCGRIYFPDFSGARYRVMLNTRRYQHCRKLQGDPRYQCLVPQILVTNSKAIVPAIPVFYPGFIYFAHRGSWQEKLGRFLSVLRFKVKQLSYKNFLDNAGFLPFLVANNSLKICAGSQKSLRVVFDKKGKAMSIESELLLDAVIHKFSLANFLAGRKELGECPLGIGGRLKARVALEDKSMTFAYSVHIAENNLRHLRLVHFNVRCSTTAGCRIEDDNRSIALDEGILIKHSEDIVPLKSFEVPGSMGMVRYYRCERAIDGEYTGNLTTQWNFL